MATVIAWRRTMRLSLLAESLLVFFLGHTHLSRSQERPVKEEICDTLHFTRLLFPGLFSSLFLTASTGVTSIAASVPSLSSITIETVPCNLFTLAFSYFAFRRATCSLLALRPFSHVFYSARLGFVCRHHLLQSCQLTAENIQSKGRIRRILVFETFPCQPHFGLSQEISSSPKSLIASISESDGMTHFRCKVMLWPPLGHANTSW